MRFIDRKEAGEKLSLLLSSYKGKKKTIVLGLARGGIVIAAAIAKALNLPFNVVVPRKLGAPYNPELAIGAIAEDGEAYLNEEIIAHLNIPPHFVAEEIAMQKKTVQKRLAQFRSVAPLEELKDKTVILVDDGIATGATMLAEMQSLRKIGVKKLIVASPVAATESWKKIQSLADDSAAILIEDDFFGISSFYENFEQVEDETVVSLLKGRQ